VKVKAKSIRSLSKVLKIAAGINNIRLAINFKNLNNDDIERLGFILPPAVGDYLIPSSIGKFTQFNANGKEIVRKDLPKESFSVMYHGTTRDWHGGLHTNTMTRTAKRYPREFVSAPSEKLQITEIDSELYICSSELNLVSNEELRNIHVCNLMLECFSEFEIINPNKNKIIGPTLRTLQWEILPKGQYPWKIAKSILNTATMNLEAKDREVILHRMEVISKRNPDFLATGRGGFSGYFVYGFTSQDRYVLESIHLDNATYIFESDWESLSQMTKNEIINGDVNHQRVIHNKRWAMNVGQAIRR